MNPRTLHVETSVWGSLAPRQPRERKHVVQRLLRLLASVRGTALISHIVLIEIEAAPAEYSVPIAEAIHALKPWLL
jgi:hypothetical protein